MLTAKKPLFLDCPFCEVQMDFDGERYICYECRATIRPGPTYCGLKSLWRDEQRYKKSISQKGGGNRVKKREDKPTKKKEWWYCET